jgi:hypothetical protein
MRKHPHDLMDRYARSGNASLSMANAGVDRYSITHA